MNRSEMRTLGRVGQPLSGGTYRRSRRRLRAPRWLTLPVVVALLALLWVGVAANREVGGDPVAAPQRAVPQRPVAGDQVSRSGRQDLPSFATVDGLTLALPHPRPAAIAFHEASRVEALELVPTGRLVANDNATRFIAPADSDGPAYRVLSSRGRTRPPTSAVDIVVPMGDAVAAPVDGTVTSVTEYPLYGRIRDWRVEITPTARPDLTVVLIHLQKPVVSVGATVVAGETSLAVPRLLPIDSHVDYVLDEKQPHAHLEVKPSVETGPVDPNEPALPSASEVGDL